MQHHQQSKALWKREMDGWEAQGRSSCVRTIVLDRYMGPFFCHDIHNCLECRFQLRSVQLHHLIDCFAGRTAYVWDKPSSDSEWTMQRAEIKQYGRNFAPVPQPDGTTLIFSDYFMAGAKKIPAYQLHDRLMDALWQIPKGKRCTPSRDWSFRKAVLADGGEDSELLLVSGGGGEEEGVMNLEEKPLRMWSPLAPAEAARRSNEIGVKAIKNPDKAGYTVDRPEPGTEKYDNWVEALQLRPLSDHSRWHREPGQPFDPFEFAA